MKLAGDIAIAAPLQAVFDALRDARLFASCVEGVRDLVEIDDRHYRAVTPFDLAEPRTLREAVAALDPDDGAVRAVAGGTALMLMMKAGVFRPTRLISLRRVEPVFSIVTVLADGTLDAGALVTLTAL